MKKNGSAARTSVAHSFFVSRGFLAAILFAMFLCPAVASAATITYVQGNYATPQSTQATVSVTFTSAQAAGDINVVVVGWNDSTAAVTAVTDSRGNVYTRAVGPTAIGGVASQAIYYSPAIVSAGAGANIVTVAFSPAAAYADVRILEYNGADPTNPVDVVATATGNGGTDNSGSVTTTNATDLLFGANLVTGFTGGPGSGFTNRLLTAPDGDVAEDQMVAATGSYNATAPGTGQWIMQMVAFRTPTGGTGSAPAITSGSSTTFVVGTAGSFTVTATGTPTPSITETGALPSGVTFTNNGNGTATLAGTPAAGTAKSYPLTITATNGVGSPATQSFTLTVNQSAAITSTNNAAFIVGTAGTFMVTATGTPTPSITETGALPSGVTFTNNGNGTATLAGTPAAGTAKSYPLTITATNGVGTPATQSFSLTVQADTQPPTTPSNLTATAVSGTQINLSWTASTDNVGVTSYLIESCQGASCSSFAQIATSSGTTYSNTALTAGASYSYRVRATDAAGNLSSYSNVATATTPTTIPGLVAAYSFDEGTGTTVNDLSGNGNNGTITNATWTTVSKFGNALVFNGTNSVVTIPDSASLHLTSGMTLEAWVNPSTVNGAWRDVIYKGNDNYFLEGTSNPSSVPAGGSTIGSSDDAIYATAALTPTTWTHLALTYDGTTLRLYVNGVQVSSLAQSGTIATSTNPLQIGGDNIYGQYFAGTIDEVRVYNVALTAAQIQSDMITPINTGGTGSAPAITSGSSTTFVVGTAGSFTVTATGTPTPSITETGALPSGVTFTNNGNGTATLAGTPAAGTAKSYPLTITATNGVGSPATQSFTLTVNQSAAITSTNNAAFIVGTAGTFMVTATGTPTPSITETGALPSGVTFTNNGNGTATLAGTPAAGTAKSYPLTITATNGVGSPATQSFTLTVSAATQAPAITSAASTTFTIGAAGTFTVTTTGTPTPAITETGSLPSSVTLKDNGNGTATLSGTPATGTAGSYPLTITATNGVGTPATQSFSLTVQADTQPPTTPSNLTATAVSGTQINLSWTASTDNVGVTSYLIESCQGASCSSFAQIATSSGTTYSNTALTAGASYSYRVRATDAAGNLSSYSNVATATTPTTIPGLVAAYSFDEGTGTTVNDLSGNGNNGTITNATWTTVSKFGNALVFNGTNSVVTIPDSASLHLTSGMTLEAWVNPSTVNGAWRDVIYKGNDNYFLEGTSNPSSVPAGGSTIGSSDDAIYATAALTPTTWTHLALTYDGTTLRLYVNGVQVSSLAQSGTIATSTNPLQIGGDNIYGQYFAGTIDEVRVYNVALTAAQIQSDMITPINTGGTGSAPAITSGSSTTFVVGTAGSFTVTATGTPTPSITETGALPSGVTFTNNGNGTATLAGTPAAGTAKSYPLTITATNGVGSPATQSFTLTVSAATQAPAITSASSTTFWVASAGTFTVTATGTPAPSITETGALPSGVTFTNNGNGTATLAGTPATGTAGSYPFTITATNGVGSPATQSFTLTVQIDTQPPTMPTNLTATAVSGSQINLSWTASTDNVGVTGYLIERCAGVGCSSFARVLTVPGTTYSDTGLVSNTSYTYQVKATDAAGNFSPYSNTATATTLSTISGLVAAYSFDEGTGTAVNDLSGNGNTGTISNATWTSSAKFGNALAFNGTNSVVTIPDSASLHLSSGMTLEAWVNPSAVNSAWRDVIYKNADNYYLEATSNSPASVPGAGSTIGSTDSTIYGLTALTPGTWAYLAFTYDGTTLRLYVNGVQVSSLATSGTIASSTNPLQIGGDSFHTQYFQGTIDEVRVYNVALNQTQIQSDMTVPVGASGTLPIVSFGTSSIAFGTQQTGTASSPQPVTLTNAGGGTLAIGSIAIAGGNAGDFTQTNNCPAALAVGGSCTINVTFAPTATGARNSFVRVTDNAPGSPQSVTLSGTGAGFAVAPRVTVLTFTGQQQFTGDSGGITWSVDGVVGGSSSTGTITTGGLYTPPSVLGTHIVTGTTSTQSANATVYLSNDPGMFTFHNDNFRSGENLSETALTPGNVNQSQFGKLFSYSLDGLTYSSPLYVANVNIPSLGYRNVVYVATEHDSVYAFDASGASPTPIWHTSFLKTGVTSVPCNGTCSDIPTEFGITGTPVIDPSTGTLYVVAYTQEGTNYVQRLHALDITTGAEKFGGPVVIQASISGSGAGSQGGVLAFDPFQENQRPALLLSNGVVYISWGSHEDSAPWHGWIIGYNATTLQQTMVYCSTPDGLDGGFWATGGPGTDSTGGLFFTTGNGDFNVNTGGRDYGDSLVKVGTAGTAVDYFTPHNQATMETQNFDFSSAGPTLLVDQPGTYPHLLVQAAKTGTIFVLNRDNLGHYNPNNDNQVVQNLVSVLPNGTEETGNYSAPAYFNGFVYFAAVNDNLKAFQLTSGQLSTGPTSQSPELYPNRGGSFSVSANGSSNGIVWAVQDNSPSNGVLYAYDAGNLSNELYNSNQVASRDALGLAMKMIPPVVANGEVFVVAHGQLVVYGLLP